MDDIGDLLSAVLDLFRIEFTLYGFTLSLWQVFCFSVVAGLAAWIVGEVISGD